MEHEPDNVDRARWARLALDAYPASEHWMPVQSIGDLITDLCHLLVREGMAPSAVREFLSSNCDRFDEEAAEEVQ